MSAQSAIPSSEYNGDTNAAHNEYGEKRFESLLGARLQEFQKASGLPVALGGIADRNPGGRRLRITKLVGTLTHSLLGFEIAGGQGVGGIVITRANPIRVDDYVSAKTITHDFDDIIVRRERIRSLFAVPVVVDGVVRGAIYGATRDGHSIGDAVMRRASLIASSLAADLEKLSAVRPPAGPSDLTLTRSRQALRDLAELAKTTTDPKVQSRLARIIADLGGTAWIGPTDDGSPSNVTLAPRELDVLRLMELGASNIQIADELGLSIQTVKAYNSSAMRRLGVRNRTSAIHSARALGFL
ncbi:LuxR C-terminal-related transcriptional regulator [Arthrobacter sp. EpRS71]|uniref:helix-turn-helix transcriptional regulator n=1 Tax=Arthrobacter sp. EpRS71 TaxID=1743141 RepID=UPI0007488ADF|nr:LuxR C-terminal-related transcriptional regulator [Arthrobacter sp. EpRS71]KUM42210.1 hypothetical protein AR689_01175 [Arthrobacter sp. EpRS71]